jgi:type I restriction enzyme S subunit
LKRVGDGSDEYFRHFFKSERFIEQLTRNIEGLRDGKMISYKQFSEQLLPAPDPAEQRKIAACLTSLDELLAAEGRKLDALLAHKRGLMQQLFPRPGESHPRLRFPEFRNAGEWETRPLAKVAENLDNKRVPITEKDRKKGNIPYYGASGIVDYVDDYIFDENLLCISEDGANLVSRTYPIAFSISGKAWVNNHAHVIRFEDRAVQTLVEVYLNSIELKDFITGMAQPKLNRGMLDTIPIPLPPQSTEQERIADCLTSLDALIAAASRKLGGLRTHKKGLMQQLFPFAEGE